MVLGGGTKNKPVTHQLWEPVTSLKDSITEGKSQHSVFQSLLFLLHGSKGENCPVFGSRQVWSGGSGFGLSSAQPSVFIWTDIYFAELPFFFFFFLLELDKNKNPHSLSLQMIIQCKTALSLTYEWPALVTEIALCSPTEGAVLLHLCLSLILRNIPHSPVFEWGLLTPGKSGLFAPCLQMMGPMHRAMVQVCLVVSCIKLES